MKAHYSLCAATLLICLLAGAPPLLAQDAPDDPAQSLARALELDQRLDKDLRQLALDAGRTVSFTQAAGRGLRTESLRKLLAAYERVLAAQPGNKLAAAGRARLLVALGRSQEAVAAYERALELDPGNARLSRELEGLRLSLAPRARVSFRHVRHREFWPASDQDLYRVHDSTLTLQADALVIDGLRLGAGFLTGRLRQESLVYGDDDYDLNRRGYFLTADWKPRPDLRFNLRLRRELYSNDNESSYFNMPDDQELITGFALVQYLTGPWWINASFSRERDPWPEVDPVSGRGVLRVEAQELAGLAVGRALAPGWELGGSAFYEMYGSQRPDQLNLNAQLTHRPLWLPDLRLSAGLAHYFEEAENLVNLLAGYQFSILQGLDLDLRYQLEYSRNEDSWLNQADLLVSWRITPRFRLTLLGSLGRESGGDNDEYWSVDTGLEIRF